ncbi:MAG: alpha/beta hydrolase [Nanoarchaeota archaeon]
MQAFIFHGYGALPQSNWFKWLKDELEKLGIKTFIPQFPTPGNHRPENWLKVLEKYPAIDENTILIGHSLGGSFVLSVLEKHKAMASFIVGGPFGLTHREVDTMIANFSNKTFDFIAIKNNCKEFHIYYSDNDDKVPLSHGEKLAKQLGIAFTKTQGSGHFQFPSFPRLLEDVKKVK